VRAAAGIRILPLPDARPREPGPPLAPAPVRGLFDMGDGWLVVPRLGAILEGAIPEIAAESMTDEGGESMTEPVILVVEDSPTNLRLITDALRADGYAILTAADGEEAIATTVRDRPSLLVLDVILPRKNGFQVCRQLRNMPETKDIPILMLTSKNQESDRFWGLRQGADEYMTKPYEMDDLRAAVRRLIQPASGA
jgi:twitching motility two-component system response regulator PilH